MEMTLAPVVTCSRLVACALGMVETLVELLAETWQPPRSHQPWYMHGERPSRATELIAAGPGKACRFRPLAASAIIWVNSVPCSAGMGYSRALEPSKILPAGSILPPMLPALPDTPTSYSTLS